MFVQLCSLHLAFASLACDWLKDADRLVRDDVAILIADLILGCTPECMMRATNNLLVDEAHHLTIQTTMLVAVRYLKKQQA